MCGLLLSILLILVGLILVGGSGAMAEEKPRVLLARSLSLNLPDIKIKGKLSLFSLNPLTGRLDIQEADGDPRRIFELISESSGLLHDFSTTLPLQQLSLRDGSLSMTTAGVTFRFKRVEIPQGRWEKVSGEIAPNKRWKVASGRFLLTEFPLEGQSWEPLRSSLSALFPLGFATLSAEGDQRSGQWDMQRLVAEGVAAETLKVWTERLDRGKLGMAQDLSLDAERLRVENLASLPDSTGLIRQVMAYAGRAAQPGGALTFDRGMVRSLILGQDRFQVNPMRFSAQDLQIWGTVEAQPLPNKPGLVEIELTAKRSGWEAKPFRWRGGLTENFLPYQGVTQ